MRRHSHSHERHPSPTATYAVKVRRHVGRWAGHQGANAAIIFGLSAFPIILLIGAGVDYSRASKERTQLQAATDAAVLSGLVAARQNASSATITSILTSIVQSDDNTSAAAVKNYTFSTDRSTLCVNSVSQINTQIMAVANIKTVPVAAHACAEMNLDTYEIAIAIDNSGSMMHSANNGQTKIDAARQAAKGLVSALTAPNPVNAVTASFSLVPFAASVNIGPAYKTASFMDSQGQSSIHWENINRVSSSIRTLPTSRFDLYTSLGVSWGGCVEARPGSMVNDDTKASTAVPDSLYVPMFAPDEIDASTLNSYLTDTAGKCTAADSTLQTDAQSRLCKYYSQGLNGQAYKYGGVKGPNVGCTTTALTPLDATASDINSALDAMTPKNGDTTELEGVMWAWRTISPNGPFTTTNTSSTSGQQNPKVYNYASPTNGSPNHKVIVLLTDGEDHWVGQYPDPNGTYSDGLSDPNHSFYSSLGYFGNNRLGTTTASNARTLVDNATIAACTNAKKLNVEIYTVGLLATDGISQLGLDLLQKCATDSSHSYIAQDGNDLIQTFQKIAASLSRPRIAQ